MKHGFRHGFLGHRFPPLEFFSSHPPHPLVATAGDTCDTGAEDGKMAEFFGLPMEIRQAPSRFFVHVAATKNNKRKRNCELVVETTNYNYSSVQITGEIFYFTEGE